MFGAQLITLSLALITEFQPKKKKLFSKNNSLFHVNWKKPLVQIFYADLTLTYIPIVSVTQLKCH